MRDKVGGLLLLTATPMQLHDFELYSMIELVEPGLFNGYGDFTSSQPETAAINQAVSALRSQNPSASAISEARVLLERFGAPVELQSALDGTTSQRETVAEWLSRCHRLSQALVRNRKTEIGGFTKRVAHREEVQPQPAELKLQDDLLAYIRDRYSAEEPGKRSAVGLVLVAFQKMLCSSSRALAGSLETRASRLLGEAETANRGSDDPDLINQEQRLHDLASEDEAAEVSLLRSLARRARGLDDAKLGALEELVDRTLGPRPGEKILIFSQFLESIEMIREHLSDRYAVRVFHGGMSRAEKDAAHEAFRRNAQILISSEAGGEGRNFQFCHIVVNYDLPWNPMKIEQRIGRVDRVGQERDVEIHNFAVRGMLDERILDVLEYRIQVFTETVGALDPILESFEDEVSHIALGARGDAEDAFGQLEADLDEQIRQAEELEELRHDFVLDWRSFRRDEADRLQKKRARATREDLERFCRTAIGRFGEHGSVEADPEGGLLICVPGMLRKGKKGVEEDYRGSFEVQEALRDEGMDFFAMGHPLVESIIDSVGDPWWAPVTALESSEWNRDRLALLVDYRLELHGIRNSGCLISHVVTEEGVEPVPSVEQPRDPSLEIRLPSIDVQTLSRLQAMSWDAARREAAIQFETYKADDAALLEEEIERIMRMFDSRSGFVSDRVARNSRQIDRLEEYGTESQRRILPALRGQIQADERRLADFKEERTSRLGAARSTLPAQFLRLLGVSMIVPTGRLEEMAA